MTVLIFNIPYNVGQDAKVLFIIPEKRWKQTPRKNGYQPETQQKEVKKIKN